MNKYLITFESGNYEWTKEKEIKGIAAAKCIGAQKAKEQNKYFTSLNVRSGGLVHIAGLVN